MTGGIFTGRPRLVPRRTERERFTAFHEAGHAVAMYVLGYRVARVTIQPSDGALGWAEPGRPMHEVDNDDIDARDQLERYCMVLHAGNAAQKILDASQTVTGYGSQDHEGIHRAIGDEEDDPGVREAWCAYLWQRSTRCCSPSGAWCSASRTRSSPSPR